MKKFSAPLVLMSVSAYKPAVFARQNPFYFQCIASFTPGNDFVRSSIPRLSRSQTDHRLFIPFQ